MRRPTGLLCVLVLIAGSLLIAGCGDGGAETESTSEPTPSSSPPTESGGVADEAAAEGCPVTCSADSEAWGIVFGCEDEGQSVVKTYSEGFSTSFVDGVPHVAGEMEFTYEGSGNTYRVDVEVVPCDESSTGFCITAEATGGALSDQPVVCQNH